MAWQVGHPLKRDGISQRQRLPAALRPENVPIDDRRTEDLLLYLYKLAEQFAYYDRHNRPAGNWQPFFERSFRELLGLRADEELVVTRQTIRRYLAATAQRRDNSTFMALLLAFLEQFSYLQQDINQLTRQHLEFYFEQVLGFRRRPPRPNRVHILFEAAPQTEQVRIAAGTALKAGQDALGRRLTYLTDREIIVNQATLGQTKTLLRTLNGSLYAAEQADSADGMGAPLEGALPQWPTFGDPAFMQRSRVGLAIASPLLLLQEGRRVITLTLTFADNDEDEPLSLDRSAFERFQVSASGEEEWITLGPPTVGDPVNRTIRLTVEAPPATPPIVAYNREVLSGNLNTDFPVLRLSVESLTGALNRLILERIDLEVEVKATANEPGVQDLVVQNDLSVLDSNSNFQPFGPEPYLGARFYIGSREIFGKPVTDLTLLMQWADLPEGSFSEHYSAYRNFNYTPQPLPMAVRLNGNWQPSGTINLFPNSGPLPEATPTISLTGVEDLTEFEEYSPEINRGFIRLTLGHTFGHRAFPTAFAQVAAEPVVFDTSTPPKPIPKEFPEPPYTPTLQSLSLGYEASQQIRVTDQNENTQLFHLLPFGSDELEPNNQQTFLPQVAPGTLYLGIENLQPPQNLHLLFQMAEGSAASTDIVRRENIEWTYLTALGWRNEPLSGSEIFIDSTQGLQRAGILAFSIGRDATDQSRLLPAGFHWLRARLTENVTPAGAARTVAIHTQATTAVFRDNNNDPNHLLEPLPPERIGALVSRNSDIRRVSQPYAAFGGAPAEQNNGFYTRVSERLRHKQRAVTLWDFERLVLEEFPAIYKVKTIPHTGLDQEELYSEFQPGQLTVVVIPQLRNQNAVNPLQPTASVALLEDIRRYLLPFTTQFVGRTDDALHLINPRYEAIQLSMKVGFREGFDGGFYAEVLNGALQRRLSPWAFEEGVDIQFGGKIYKSQLLAFVEEQEYVDYVTDFRMFHRNAGPGIGEMCIEIDLIVRPDREKDEGVDVAVASSEVSVLVSANEHLIEVLQLGEFPCDEPDICDGGIGCWIIEGDFIVS